MTAGAQEQGARPPESPLAMPAQGFARPAAPRARGASRLWRKGLVGAIAVALTLWAAHEMYRVLDVAGMTSLEWALLAIFCLNICWIAFAFASASAGFAVTLVRAMKKSAAGAGAPLPEGRTAVLFPVYNEDVRRVFGTVETVMTGLAAAAPGRFECFVLSDTTNPDIALLEEAAFVRLRERLGALGSGVFYRRRTINRARKSGNIEDFVTRWGGRYDYMIVYDADSYMETETLIALARRIEAEPRTGLVQTIPQLVGGETLFARAQQFAAGLYGPLLGAGVAWWAQDEGNFWGHNAIIRVRAFAEAAGLPTLPGKAPFGGAILSHDFVEAALLRRAGWRVRIADDLGGSYEESPPTVIDLAARDRRWCQGNLQHLGVLARMRGLLWTSRLHLMIGVYSYLASPIWLLLILVGMALSLQGKFLQPDYFGAEATLFPNWPVIDSARALALFGATMAILFAPKIFGLVAGLASRRWRSGVGASATLRGVIAETVLSVLVAPVLMSAQTSAVVSILAGRDAGWTPQRREAGGYAFADVMRRHGATTLLGVALTLAAFAISPVFAAWLAPATIGLILAGPLSHWTGSAAAGAAAKGVRLLLTPEEVAPPASYLGARRAAAAYADLVAPSFAGLLTAPSQQARREPLADARWPLKGNDVHAPLALALARAERFEDADAFAAALPAAEKLALLNSPAHLARLSARFAPARPPLRLATAGGE